MRMHVLLGGCRSPSSSEQGYVFFTQALGSGHGAIAQGDLSSLSALCVAIHAALKAEEIHLFCVQVSVSGYFSIASGDLKRLCALKALRLLELHFEVGAWGLLSLAKSLKAAV